MTTRSESRRPTRLTRARRWLSAWLDAYLPRLRRRRPSVSVEVGPWLPGWVLRALLAAGVLALAAPLQGGPVAGVVVLLLAGLVFARPSGVPAGVTVIFLAVLLGTRTEAPSPGLVAIVVAGLPALVQLGAVVGRTGLRARVELAALILPLPRYAAHQVLAQPLALLGGWLASTDALGGPGWVLLAVVVVCGLGVLAYGWLPRLAQRLS